MSLHVTRDSLKRYQGQTAALNITQKHQVNQQPDQNQCQLSILVTIHFFYVSSENLELQQAQVL